MLCIWGEVKTDRNRGDRGRRLVADPPSKSHWILKTPQQNKGWVMWISSYFLGHVEKSKNCRSFS